jgi:hypothetical protein
VTQPAPSKEGGAATGGRVFFTWCAIVVGAVLMVVGAFGGRSPSAPWSDVGAYEGLPVDLPRPALSAEHVLPVAPIASSIAAAGYLGTKAVKTSKMTTR